jgi:cytochrome c-type biogenesis protein CcmF
VAFNITVVIQEFVRGVKARQSAKKTQDETIFASLFNLVAKARRRYGGYTVHVGIAIMFLGFTGRAWGVDKEISLMPGEEVQIEYYSLKYMGSRMEVDAEKRMIFADMEVTRQGKPVGPIHPAKFIYMKGAEQPSTEVAKYMNPRDDLYVIVGMVNPQTKMAAFQLHVNPMVNLIWLGVGILILGAMFSLWPDVALEEAGVFGYIRAAASVGASVVFALLLAGGPAIAYGGTHGPSPHVETPASVNTVPSTP